MPAQEQNLVPRDTGAPSVISSGHVLDLRSWLEVAWFYPDGFSPVSVVETKRSLLAFGEREVFKFIKPGSLPPQALYARPEFGHVPEPVSLKWADLVDEISDNLAFAPGVYRGIRALRWDEGEAQWLGERSAADLNSSRPAFAADELAITMRRLPEHRRLDNLLSGPSGGGQSADLSRPLLALATALVRQHRRGVHWGKKLFESDTETILELFYEKYVSELRSFILLNGSYLDSFSRTVFQEISVAIERMFSRLEDRFIERGQRGLVTDGHGNLRLDRIWYEVRGHGTPEISILGRQIARARAFGIEHGVDRTLYRHADALDDIAAICVDLRSRGLFGAAEEFERMIFRLHPEIADPEVLRFFVMVHTVRQAMRALDLTSSDDRILNSDLLLRSRSIGMRAALQLDQPFILAFPTAGTDDCADDSGTESRERRRDLMRTMAELTDAPLLTIDQAIASLQTKAQALGPFHRLIENEVSLHDWILDEVRRQIAGRSVIVIEWPSASRDAQERLGAAAAELKVPLLLVHCSLGQAELVNRNARHDFSRGKSEIESKRSSDRCARLTAVGQLPNIASTVVEPTVTSPDLGFGILRDFAARLADRPK